jgi:adenylate kinase
VDRVIYLDIPDDIVFERVMQRAKKGLGSGFTKRADDNPDALKVRLEQYYGKTKPLLELYEQKGCLLTVDGTKEISEVYSDISAALGFSVPKPSAQRIAKVEASV